MSGKVQYLTNNSIRVEVDGGITGVVPDIHLSDHPAHCAPIKATLARDTFIKEMLIWCKNDAQKKLILSCKPYLIEAAKSGKIVLAKEDFKSGMIIPVSSFRFLTESVMAAEHLLRDISGSCEKCRDLRMLHRVRQRHRRLGLCHCTAPSTFFLSC